MIRSAEGKLKSSTRVFLSFMTFCYYLNAILNDFYSAWSLFIFPFYCDLLEGRSWSGLIFLSWCLVYYKEVSKCLSNGILSPYESIHSSSLT